jgi:integrase
VTRRGAREGTIRQRPDSRWEARYRGPDGRQRSLYAATRRGAQERLRAALTASEQGIRPIESRLTVGAFLEGWLASSVRLRCRSTTADNYTTIVRLYLQPAIGRIPLAKLEPEHVQAMLAKLSAGNGARGEQLSPTTVRYVYAVLRIALGRALKAGRVVRNVATLVDPPAKAKAELTPLSADQVATFLSHVAGDRLEALYVTAIGLGLRQGELLGLRWSDVDLEAGMLTIRHTLQRGTRTLAEPKTERARRTLQLPSEVTAALRAHRKRQLDGKASEYVFASSSGRPLDPRNVARRFAMAIAAAGLPAQRFHDLRHACATLLLEQGEDLAVVSKLLGHANLSTTADVYAHLTPAMGQRAAERMDGVLRRRPAAI